MKHFSRKLVTIFMLIIWQSSLGTKAAQINAQNLGQNGYRKYEDGLLIQWGYRKPQYTGLDSVIFPIAFADENYTLTISPNINSSIDKIDLTEEFINIYILGKQKEAFGTVNILYNLSPYTHFNCDYEWQAIGRWK